MSYFLIHTIKHLLKTTYNIYYILGTEWLKYSNYSRNVVIMHFLNEGSKKKPSNLNYIKSKCALPLARILKNILIENENFIPLTFILTEEIWKCHWNTWYLYVGVLFIDEHKPKDKIRVIKLTI